MPKVKSRKVGSLRGAGRAPAQVKTRGLFYPDSVEVREVDSETRSAVFVAATEGGVQTWAGPEFLRMSGANLERYRKNSVILDTHNRWEAGAIIGRAKRVWIEQRKLMVEVIFAETTRGDDIWKLVKGGFLNALSVGFIPSEVLRLAEGESNGVGKNKVKGPARVVKEWELYEISVVPVPADADALKRSFFGDEEDPRNQTGAPSARKASRTRERSRNMDPKFKQYLEARGLDPAVLSEDSLEALKKDFDAEGKRAADLKLVEESVAPVDTEERETPEEVTLRARVLAVCPEGMKEYAEKLLLVGGKVVRDPETKEEAVRTFTSFEEYRSALITEATRRSATVGTTPPADETENQDEERSGAPEKVADLKDDVAIRAIAG